MGRGAESIRTVEGVGGRWKLGMIVRPRPELTDADEPFNHEIQVTSPDGRAATFRLPGGHGLAAFSDAHLMEFATEAIDEADES